MAMAQSPLSVRELQGIADRRPVCQLAGQMQSQHETFFALIAPITCLRHGQSFECEDSQSYKGVT